MMSRVRAKNTTPEMLVRRTAHALGLRFRLHRKDLPGKPDLVLSKYNLAIFVHGCFWHRHSGCPKASVPKSREQYWKDKFEANVARDERVVAGLSAMGWRVVILWECEIKQSENISEMVRKAVHELR